MGPLITLQFCLGVVFFLLLGFHFYKVVKERKKLTISIPSGILFICLTALLGYVYVGYVTLKAERAKKFLGDYKLLRLDSRDCDICKVTLYGNYRYDIFVGNELTGHGKWSVGTALDIPGVFLKIENGPKHVIWEEDRVIDYIYREN